MNPKAKQRLEAIYKRFQEINALLSKSNITKDIATMTKLSKERSKIEAVALLYQEYVQEIQNNKDAKDLFRSEEDADLHEWVRNEIERSVTKILTLESNLRVLLLPSDPNDNKNVIVEIRGAAGGDEANIFAGDLFRMYSRYSETQGWKLEILEAKISDAGGFTQISFLIKGKNVYAKMKFEAGSHRVQRIPKTESKGRVHTSTATVAILPEATEVDVEIKPADLKIDTYRASGAGGQHVNTTDSAVRITHIPTGIVVTSQDGRSQHDNKDKALKVLYAKIYEAQLIKQQSEMTDLRKIAVGSGQRAEKIRTYNYPQNRITDHRVNLSWQKLDHIIEGSLDEIIESLINHEQRIKMEEED